MTHQWSNLESNYCLRGNVQGNQISFYSENNYQNTKQIYAKAYVNPQIVNYEFIERSLSGAKGSNKIHVNPNFRRNGLNNPISETNYPRIINAINLNSQNSFLNNAVTSAVKKDNSNISAANNNGNFDTSTIPLQSRFKKVNAVSVKTNKSLHSWSKSKLESNFSTNARLMPNADCRRKVINQNYSQNLYKYTSPKKVLQVQSQTSLPKKNHSIFKSRTKIINESKTKLINDVSPKTKLNFKDRRIQLLLNKQLSLSKFACNKSKKSSISKVANAVRSKYKYLNNPEQFKKSKYKIDKRNRIPETVKRKANPSKIEDITKLFPNHFYNKFKLSSYNIYNVNNCHTSSKSIRLWRKDQPSESANHKILSSKFPNKRVIKIGGILYKSTTNKLTLASKRVENSSKRVMTSASKAKKKHVVYVRGEKFILENNGKALRRQPENVTNDKALLLTPRRIDIGGVTYIQKSKNVLIRTNVHQARHLVNKAKNKSIAMLAKLYKRSSMPCMIYHRFGKCLRHTKGLCMYKHDPKNIAVCKKFLKGICTNDKCLLSHEVVQEKMATCHFFLNGLCVRENCPFLHVKLSKNAEICENFIQGFCNLGKECSKRHLHQCPEFDKTGICNLGSKCPYPHKKLNKNGLPLENSEKSKDESEKLQYYVHLGTQKKSKKVKRSANKVKENASTKQQKEASKKKALSLNAHNQSSDVIKCFPKRVKLDKLPCFIPLSTDS